MIAAPATAREEFEAVADECPSGLAVEVADGGAARSESVRAALRAAGAEVEVVCVHDAARPFVTAELIDACCDALVDGREAAGVIAAAAITDTVKRVGRDGTVEATEDRDELWVAQTPQVFRAQALSAALDRPGADLAAATDDAGLVEQAGGRILIHPAPASNFKVTTPEDLARAAAILAGSG